MLGQIVTVRLILENPTSDRISFGSVYLHMGGDRIIPYYAMPNNLDGLAGRPKEKVVYEFPLLWNVHTPDRPTTPIKPKDRIVFNSPGQHHLTITTNVYREPWPTSTSTRSQRRKIHSDLTISLAADIRAPETAAEMDWWAMVQDEPNLLIFLLGGLPEASKEKRLFRVVNKYVKAHPDHPIAQTIAAHYKRIMDARAEYERRYGRQ